MQLAYVCIVTICTHTKQIQAARILYACVQFVHILHMCTLHVCCVERNICAAHILRLSIFVGVIIATIHDKDTKLTSVFLKMSPNSSWNSQGSLYRRSDLGLPTMLYGCHGSSWNSKLVILDKPAII